MKNIILVIGNGIKYNSIFLEYLTNQVKNSIGVVDSTIFIDKNDDDIFSLIEDTTKKYKNIIIAAYEGFELVGKILSTLTNDTLVVDNNMLLPSKREKISTNSYLVNHKNIYINVLKIDTLDEIGDILLEDREEKLFFYLFADEKQNQKVIKYANIFELQISKTELIEGLTSFCVRAKNRRVLEHFIEQIDISFKDSILYTEELSSFVVKRLIESGKTITTAESCTGGLIASELTKHSGVSSIYHGSIVSYSNSIKHSLLGVKEDTLLRYGAVSKECVKEMLDGVMQKFRADFAIAVSGIAGPTGGTLEKPVGTVIIGIKNSKNILTIKKLYLKGDRRFIQQSTKYWAFKLLIEQNRKIFFKFMTKTLDK